MASQEQEGEREYKVVLVGSAKVGKTSLIQRYMFDEFNEDVPQTGSEERKIVQLKNGKCVPLRIVDLVGTDISHTSIYKESLYKENTHRLYSTYLIRE